MDEKLADELSARIIAADGVVFSIPTTNKIGRERYVARKQCANCNETYAKKLCKPIWRVVIKRDPIDVQPTVLVSRLQIQFL